MTSWRSDMPRVDYKLKNGEPVSGATTILRNCGWGSDALIYWAWKRGKEFPQEKLYEKQQEYFDIGTLAHAYVEADLKGETLDPQYVAHFTQEINEKAIQAHKNFLHWHEGNHVE